MKNNMDTRLTIRLTPEQYESIAARAETAMITPSTHVRAAAMRHKVTVIPGLDEVARELKGIGRNLNQLTVLVNMGKVKTVYLECTISPELAEELAGLMELTIRELREIKARLGRLSTEEERKQDGRLLEQIATAVEQAGERRFSLPRLHLPGCNLMWLLAIPVALGLLVGCYALRHSWDVLWRFFQNLTL